MYLVTINGQQYLVGEDLYKSIQKDRFFLRQCEWKRSEKLEIKKIKTWSHYQWSEKPDVEIGLMKTKIPYLYKNIARFFRKTQKSLAIKCNFWLHPDGFYVWTNSDIIISYHQNQHSPAIYNKRPITSWIKHLQPVTDINPNYPTIDLKQYLRTIWYNKLSRKNSSFEFKVASHFIV